MSKVILIVSDAMRYDAAVRGMGYLGHLVEKQLASLYRVIGELPSMSRPIYETIHTGMHVSSHGIVANSVIRKSTQPNIFQLATKNGKITAAAAYYWFSELYNRIPYDVIDDREVDDPGLCIQHGRFYTQDEYADLEVFHSAAALARKFHPDYLLIHPLGMDVIGESFGSDSSEYRNRAIRQDAWLAPLVGEWLKLGYTILFTGDHGMNADKMHGGTTAEMREVPLYVINPELQGKGDTGEIISQLQIAPTVCKLLDIPIPETMKFAPLI
jgi:predicted AlkP superfamily pyrophosphatase or phosphodiesterase